MPHPQHENSSSNPTTSLAVLLSTELAENFRAQNSCDKKMLLRTEKTNHKLDLNKAEYFNCYYLFPKKGEKVQHG